MNGLFTLSAKFTNTKIWEIMTYLYLRAKSNIKIYNKYWKIQRMLEKIQAQYENYNFWITSTLVIMKFQDAAKYK